MDPDQNGRPKGSLIHEGRVSIRAVPSGSGKGPGTKGSLFYNASMVQNRDMSMLLLQAALEGDEVLLTHRNRILDGLCGCGVRAIRFSAELNPGDSTLEVHGVDIDDASIEMARYNARENGVAVEFHREDLNHHLSANRYSYIDVDPFGSPVPFLRSALRAVSGRGIIGVTATDTAALCGSSLRAGFRRYGVRLSRSPFMHEISCRTLMGYIARTAASMERSVRPLLFYSSDHFVRGYVLIGKGARRADEMLKEVGWLALDPPGPPRVIESVRGLAGFEKGTEFVGPVWIGDLESGDFLKDMIEMITEREPSFGHLKSLGSIMKLLLRGMEENGLPPGGYDVNDLAGKLRMSPSPVEKTIRNLIDEGYRSSRSRFSPTMIRTEAPREAFIDAFRRSGG